MAQHLSIFRLFLPAFAPCFGTLLPTLVVINNRPLHLTINRIECHTLQNVHVLRCFARSTGSSKQRLHHTFERLRRQLTQYVPMTKIQQKTNPILLHAHPASSLLSSHRHAAHTHTALRPRGA